MAPSREEGAMTNALAWTPPVGHAEIAPSRFERIEGEGYLTLDADWIVPALLSLARFRSAVGFWSLRPAADIFWSKLKRAGLIVESFDVRAHTNPLVPDVGPSDIRKLESLAGFNWAITNLPYNDLEELTEILVKLGTRDRRNVALLVRAEWPIAKAQRNLIHLHPWFAGIVQLTSRPRWMPKEQETASPRHNFCWCVWGVQPRVGDA
jgi:hypothetical protein